MLYLMIKAAISGVVIAVASEIARRSPALGALIVSLPLVSVLTIIWLWRDTGDHLRVADHVQATFWLVLPTLPMFLLMPMLTSEGEETGYALGWRHGTDERGYHSIGHGGGGVGTNNQLLCYPEEDVAVAVMVNFTDAGYGDLPRRLAWLFIER